MGDTLIKEDGRFGGTIKSIREGDISFGAVQGSNDFTLGSVIIIVPLLAITTKPI